MDLAELTQIYNFKNKSVVITGGAGVLGGEIACALVGCHANVAIMDRNKEMAQQLIKRIDTTSGRAIIVYGDVLKPDSLRKAAKQVANEFSKIDILINAAGGNSPGATTNSKTSFFDLPEEAMQFVFDLNLLGTILPSQTFGKYIAEQGEGVILNVSSMNAFRPLTRVSAYSAAKAGVSNFTQWLAVYMAQEFSSKIRVNAIAPGFFLTKQNQFLLTDEKTGDLTERGQQIIDHTPMGKFGSPEDILGTVLWLLSPASAFVTGTIIPIDGGFSAYSGV